MKILRNNDAKKFVWNASFWRGKYGCRPEEYVWREIKYKSGIYTKDLEYSTPVTESNLNYFLEAYLPMVLDKDFFKVDKGWYNLSMLQTITLASKKKGIYLEIEPGAAMLMRDGIHIAWRVKGHNAGCASAAKSQEFGIQLLSSLKA